MNCETDDVRYLVQKDVMEGKETAWINPYYLPYRMVKAVSELTVSDADIRMSSERLARFAPFIARAFPETASAGGLIESPLRAVPSMQAELSRTYAPVKGRLYLKMDSDLPISGLVKARGGIYEVLQHAEALAVENGILKPGDDYGKLADYSCRQFFGRFSIQVGSTGNLGMSIGIMGAALGFHVTVHMSQDARQWKKDLLRSHGVTVIEYDSDYSAAVASGRAAAANDPSTYFIDDEWSKNLFLGYAVAAERLKSQLEEKCISVDAEHPLLVYIPAGVGGAPGGVGYGLKRIFGDNVHVFFTEPVQCPSVLLGIAAQQFEKANVKNYGLSGKTEADGLACPSPSGFVTRLVTNLVSGDFTVSDGRLYDFLRLLYRSEQIEIEPSSCAAFMGPIGLVHFPDAVSYCQSHGLTDGRMERSTQICWATGGSMIPENIREQYREKCLPVPEF